MKPPKPPTVESVVVADAGVLSTSLDREMVLLDPIRGMYYSLNEVGARIWEILQEPTPVATISRRLRDEYDIDEEACDREVIQVISELVDRGMARTSPPDS